MVFSRNVPVWTSQPPRPQIERRPGEAVLIGAGARRTRPADGLTVLMLGESVSALMLQGFILGELPGVRNIEIAAHEPATLDLIARDPGRYDLVLFKLRPDGAALDFADDLSARLHGRPAPFVVLLAEQFAPKIVARCEANTAFSARLLTPLTDARLRLLIGELFDG